jgi:hypothetical protein
MRETIHLKPQGPDLYKPYSTGQVAEIFQVSKHTIIQAFDEGILKGFTLPPKGKFRKIPRSSVEKYIADQHLEVKLPVEHALVLVKSDEEVFPDVREYINKKVREIEQEIRRDIEITIVNTWFDAGMDYQALHPSLFLIDTIFEPRAMEIRTQLRKNDPMTNGETGARQQKHRTEIHILPGLRRLTSKLKKFIAELDKNSYLTKVGA